MSYDPDKLKLYLEKKNDATNNELYSLCNATTKNQKGSIRKLKSRILNKLENHETVETSNKKSIQKQPPQVEGLTTPPTIPINAVGDPVAFVTSIITDELLKTRDVRWATLFVSVLRESKKLDYSTQQEIEWSNQAKSLSIEELVEKVAIKGSISKNISRRLDKADDTSPLDSFSDV